MGLLYLNKPTFVDHAWWKIFSHFSCKFSWKQNEYLCQILKVYQLFCGTMCLYINLPTAKRRKKYALCFPQDATQVDKISQWKLFLMEISYQIHNSWPICCPFKHSFLMQPNHEVLKSESRLRVCEQQNTFVSSCFNRTNRHAWWYWWWWFSLFLKGISESLGGTISGSIVLH